MGYCSRRCALPAVKPSTWARRMDIDAAADHQILEAGEHAHGAEVDGCWPEPQKRLSVTPGPPRPAGVENGHAGDVHGVVAAAVATPHDHVVDIGGVEPDPGAHVQDLGEDLLGWMWCNEPLSLPLPAGNARRR